MWRGERAHLDVVAGAARPCSLVAQRLGPACLLQHLLPAPRRQAHGLEAVLHLLLYLCASLHHALPRVQLRL